MSWRCIKCAIPIAFSAKLGPTLCVSCNPIQKSIIRWLFIHQKCTIFRCIEIAGCICLCITWTVKWTSYIVQVHFYWHCFSKLIAQSFIALIFCIDSWSFMLFLFLPSLHEFKNVRFCVCARRKSTLVNSKCYSNVVIYTCYRLYILVLRVRI